MTKLRISEDLSLPIDTLTQTMAVLAIKGAGKTNTGVVLAEEFLKKGLQVVIADPVGVWWGLRSSKDGKSAGLPVVIFGGEKGDVPLEAAGGALVADLVVDEKLSAVLDLSLLRKGEQTRFTCDFAERLYHRKGQLSHRQPLHLILDEADAFAPQRPMHGQERMLGAIDEIVRRGRARGLGVTLITQRSAAINKDVLTQIEVLFAMRNISPQDRRAIEAWIEVHGTPEEQHELMASLPSLPRGTAWVWSPGWLDLFKKVKIRERETFDSSATPKVGEKVIAPKRFAEVDLDAIRTKMSATLEKAKADDPRELRRRIAELEGELRKAQTVKPKVETTEVPVFSAADWDKLAVLVSTIDGMVFAKVKELTDKLEEFKGPLNSVLAKAHTTLAGTVAKNATTARPFAPQGLFRHAKSPATPPAVLEGVKLSSGERKILTVLAQYTERTKTQIALLTGYAVSGGGFNNYLGGLRSKGFIESSRGSDLISITQGGREALGPYEPLPTGPALQEYWLGQLGRAEGLILRALIEIYPHSLDREAVAVRTGYEAKGGGFNNALGKLRTLELIHGRHELKAAEELF